MSVLGAAVGLVYVPVSVARDAFQVAGLQGAMALVLLANVVWFRHTRKVELHGLAGLTVVMLCLLPAAREHGAQTYLWLTVLPLLACFLLGQWRGTVFSVVLIVVVSAWIHAFPPHWDAERFPVALVASLALMAGFGFIYERVKHAYARELQRLSSIDPLTGCFNRRQGGRVMAEEWNRARRYDRPLSLVLIDIDDFKRVNDEHGHHAGDVVLQLVAEGIRSGVRASDTVVRWGGEEFLVVLPETDILGARAAAQRLLERIRGSSIAPVGRVTVSAGATSADLERDGDLHRALQRADMLLYEAKRAGRDRVHVDLVTPRRLPHGVLQRASAAS